jgi:colanic acid/amylovoran biosynthesis protein
MGFNNMKVIITGVTGLRNRGVEALVTTTVDQLLQRHPDLSIDIMTESADYDHLRLPQSNINLFNRIPGTLTQRAINSASRFYKPLAPAYTRFKNASIVIATGGDVYTSDYPRTLSIYMPPLEIALHAGIPIVFLGQSIAFKTREASERWLRVARHSKLITLREKISFNYVTQELGLSGDLVKHTADSAFLLESLASDKVNQLLKAYGVTENRPVVAISPSQGIAGFTGCNRVQHLKAWHQVVKFILDELDAQVLIIPHVQENNPNNNDRLIATNLHKSLDFDHRVHLAGADHSASEFKGLIGACDMIIAERMHAAIAGLSSTVCTVVVGYSAKAEGIMNDLLGAESVQNGLLIPIQKFLEAESACSTIRTAWERRHEVSLQLQEALPRIKTAAKTNFELVSQILAG